MKKCLVGLVLLALVAGVVAGCASPATVGGAMDDIEELMGKQVELLEASASGNAGAVAVIKKEILELQGKVDASTQAAAQEAATNANNIVDSIITAIGSVAAVLAGFGVIKYRSNLLKTPPPAT